MPRCTPEKGLQIRPHNLPARLYAGISPKATNRSRENFGEDADDFVYERRLRSPSNDGRSIKEKTRLLTTFGMGRSSLHWEKFRPCRDLQIYRQFMRHFGL